MKRSNLPYIFIAAAFILIIINFVSSAGEMDLGFWLRNIANVLLIVAMLFSIRDMGRNQ